MADQTAKYNEEAVGAGHPTKADVVNRLALVEHNTDGKHKMSSGVAGDIFYHNGTNLVRLAKGTALQILRQNAALTAPEWADSAGIVSGTKVDSTSGTYIDFTSIPSGVKRITVMLSGVSTNGTSIILIQLGDSGGIETTGYVAGAFSHAAQVDFTAGFGLTIAISAALAYSGQMILSCVDGNIWVGSGGLHANGSGNAAVAFGTKTLSATLDRIRVTTVNGTDTFDAGAINILYE